MWCHTLNVAGHDGDAVGCDVTAWCPGLEAAPDLSIVLISRQPPARHLPSHL